MEIVKIDFCHCHRMGTLKNLTISDISHVLGFEPLVGAQTTDINKVACEWFFIADGHKCAIWDFKGSYHYKSWSTYGPKSVFKTLFGVNYD